ncbi:MAG: hypothetical protein FWC53_00110 [Firmicutes bacterium]|nr:hypothetical protein [Bacillota bacterium]
MKLIRNIIIIAVILLIIIVITLLIYRKYYGDNMNNYKYADESNIVINYQVEPVTNSTKFYTVEACLQTYIDTIVNGNENSIYNLLSADYISSNNINSSNVLDYINNIKQASKFTAKDMNMIGGDAVETYSVYGTISNTEDSGVTQDVYFIVSLDTTNFTFSITPQMDENIKSLSDINLSASKEKIMPNTDNQFKYKRVVS